MNLFFILFPSVMSLKSTLRSTYGAGVAEITTGNQRCLERLARHRNHVIVYPRCKKERIFPPCLRLRPPIDTLQGRRIAEQAGHRFVNEKWQLMKNGNDTTPKEETPGVIYALGCTDCAQIYFGETMRTAKQRMREHKYHTRSGHLDMSAIAKRTHEE